MSYDKHLNWELIMKRLFAVICLVILSAPAYAYIGPGAGIPVLGSLIGILVTLFLAIGAIVLWPIRRMMKRKKMAANQADDGA
jgi:hypothetical protein